MTTGTYVVTPTNWTKVRSVKVVIPSLAIGAGVRFIMNGIDPTLANDSGKTSYLSSVSWSQDWQSENGLKPYPIQVDSANAAKITVDGQKAIIKFVDQNGKEIANYPALTLQGVDGEEIPTDPITQNINTICQKKTSAGRQQYVFYQVINSVGDTSNDQEGLSSFIGSYDNDSTTNQVYTVQFNEQFDTQSATLTFVDDDQNQQMVGNQQTTKGDASTTINFAKGAQELQNLINQGYEFVSAVNTTNAKAPEVLNNQPNAKFSDIQFGNYDANPQGSKSFVIHLKHGIKTVTADDDIQSGTPINANDPQGAQYPAGVNKAALTKTVDRTINYVYANGTQAQPDHKDSLTYTATIDVDKVTGKVVPNSEKWSPNQDFKVVNTPQIKGYTPDKGSVTNKNIAYNSDPLTEKVTYNADAQKATVYFVDDETGKTIFHKDIQGHTDEKESYRTADDITSLENKGYEFVSDGYPTQGFTYDNDDQAQQTFTVHFKHDHTTVDEQHPGTLGQPINPNDPDGPKYTAAMTKDALGHDVTQTIKYVYADGKQAKPTSTKTLHFTATKTIDKVTGNVLKTEWSKAQNFTTVKSPSIPGYTPDFSQFADVNIDHKHEDLNHVVTYTPNDQTIVVKYIDDTTGKTTSKTITGKSDTKSEYTTAQTITDYQNAGYELVSDPTNGQAMTFDHDDANDQTYEVHLKHGIETITADQDRQSGTPINANDLKGAKYPAGVDKNSLTKTVDRIINYVYANGTQAKPTHPDSLTFTATVKVDKVTGKIVPDSESWSKPKDFNSVDSPTIKGYTADKVSVANTNIPYDHDAITETVTYNPDVQKATVNFIDDTTGKTINPVSLKGYTAETDSYRTAKDITILENKGYVLVKDNYPTDGVVYDNDDDKDRSDLRSSFEAWN